MNPQIKSLQRDNSTIIAHDANPSTLAEIDIASDGRIAIGSLRGGEPPLRTCRAGLNYVYRDE